MKKLLKKLLKFSVLLCLPVLFVSFSVTAFADVYEPTQTKVYFEKDGEPFEGLVEYTVDCYGYVNAGWWDTGEEIPADYDPEHPEVVYSYSATCPEYGCSIYENYYLNYTHIDYCDLSGEADPAGEVGSESFSLNAFTLNPTPDCTYDPQYNMFDGDFYYKYTDEYNQCADETCDQYLEKVPLSDMVIDQNSGSPVDVFCEAHYVIPSGDEEGAFSDVSKTDYFNDAIEYVKTEGIVAGYDDGTFKPNKTINRAEFTKILVGATLINELNSCVMKTELGDVPKGEWFYKYICYAMDKGYVIGYPDKIYKPGSEINFAEAARILAKKFVPNFDYASYTGDVWYEPYVKALQEKNAIPLSIDSVGRKITRGEMAEMIYRLILNITDKKSSGLVYY